jgi:hypothetical protein
VSPLPKEVADIVRKLVAADRADLIISVAERRLTPFEAAEIVDRGSSPKTVEPFGSTDSGCSNEKPQKRRPPKRGGKRKAAPVEPPKLDVRALIG